MGIHARFDLTRYAYSRAVPKAIADGYYDSIRILEIDTDWNETKVYLECADWSEIIKYWQDNIPAIEKANEEYYGEIEANRFQYRIEALVYN